MNNFPGWGTPGWGPPPYYGPWQPQTQPQQSGVIYLPMPNPAKEGDDPVTAFVKQKEMIERVEKLFKKEEKKDGPPKGLSVKDMWWLMAILTLPVMMAYGGIFFLVARGLKSL